MLVTEFGIKNHCVLLIIFVAQVHHFICINNGKGTTHAVSVNVSYLAVHFIVSMNSIIYLTHISFSYLAHTGASTPPFY